MNQTDGICTVCHATSKKMLSYPSACPSYSVNSDQTLKDSWTKYAKPLVQGHIVIADLYANTQVMTGETLTGIGSSAAVTYLLSVTL